MTFSIWLVLLGISLLISASGKAVMDVLRFYYGSSVFKSFKNANWWNPEISWKNKYKNCDQLQGERFPGSTTVFVFTTDGWHFFQFIFLRFFFASIIFYSLSDPILTFITFDWLRILIEYIVLSIYFGLVFSFGYKVFH